MLVRTHNCNNTVRLEERVETRKEFECEQFSGFSTTGEHVMDNVVILRRFGRGLSIFDELYSVLNHRDVVRWKVEVLGGKLVHNGINLDNGGLNPVLN